MSLLDLDLVCAFAMFVPLCFLLQLGMPGAGLFCLVTLSLGFIRRRELGHLLITRGFLILPAGLACFSMLWSQAPVESLKGGVELGLTLAAAVLLSGARRPQMVLRGIAAAFALYLAISLVAGGTTKMGLHGSAFSGLSSSKNLLADIAATGAIFSAGAAWMAMRDRAWPWLLAMLVSLGLGLVTVVIAKSAGAVVSLAVGMGAMIFLAVAMRAPSGLRALMVAFGAMAVIAFAFLHRAITQMLVSYVSELFDKDPSLTGRTYIWERGFELIRERPLLGQGFGAFWLQGNPEAEGLWRFAGITQRSGFTFHNSLIEILIQLGWVGVATLGLVLVTGVICVALRFIARPSPILCVWTAALAFELSRMPVESIGYQPFFYSTVIISAALGMAFSKAEDPDAPFARLGVSPRVSPRLRRPPQRLARLSASR